MSLIVETAPLIIAANGVNSDLIRKPLLESLGEQRKQSIFCDVSIECGNKQFAAHRCLLYAISAYCRTLFTGSLPPTYKNGRTVMELAFSSDTVQLFLDLIYGEEISEVLTVDLEELFQLADYLQISDNFLAGIYQKIMHTDISIDLLELSLVYNCSELRKITELYICNNLQYFDDYDGLKTHLQLVKKKGLSENALLALHNNPVYLSQPKDLIVPGSRKNPCDIDLTYRLISYDRDLSLSVQNTVRLGESGCKLATFTASNNNNNNCDKEIVYFIFNYELFTMISTPKMFTHEIYNS